MRLTAPQGARAGGGRQRSPENSVIAAGAPKDPGRPVRPPVFLRRLRKRRPRHTLHRTQAIRMKNFWPGLIEFPD